MTLPTKELPERSLDALIAGERTRVIEPLNEWQTLSAQLRDEGLIRSTDTPLLPSWAVPSKHILGGAPVHRSMVSQWSFRIAAGVALLAAGILIGHGGTVGNQVLPSTNSQSQTAAAKPVSQQTFTSSDEARRAILKAQSDYQRATAYLAAADTSVQLAGTPALYRERLAALDQVMSAAHRGLQDAPQDPVLNQYYQSAIGAREATQQQLVQTLPVGARVAHF